MRVLDFIFLLHYRDYLLLDVIFCYRWGLSMHRVQQNSDFNFYQVIQFIKFFFLYLNVFLIVGQDSKGHGKIYGFLVLLFLAFFSSFIIRSLIRDVFCNCSSIHSCKNYWYFSSARDLLLGINFTITFFFFFYFWLSTWLFHSDLMFWGIDNYYFRISFYYISFK